MTCLYCPRSGNLRVFRRIIESFLAARPVISSHVGGIPELVETGVTGVLIDDVTVSTIVEVALSITDENYEFMVDNAISHGGEYRADTVHAKYLQAIRVRL